MVKVSVIIPVFNGDTYLKRCLESLKIQTLEDIEFICINDGSTDKSLEIMEEYAATDSRFVIINQDNQGQGIARNNGIDAVKGEFIGFVDADDFVESDMFEKLYNAAVKHDVDCVHSNYNVVYSSINKSQESNLTDAMNTRMGKNILYYDIPTYIEDIKANLITLFSGPVWNKIYKTSVIKTHGIKFPQCKMQEDTCFNVFSHFYFKRFVIIKEKFYTYYVNAQSISTGVSQNHFEIFKALEEMKNFLIQNSFFEKNKNYYEDYVYLMFLLHAPHIAEEQRNEFLLMFKQYLQEDKFNHLKANYLS